MGQGRNGKGVKWERGEMGKGRIGKGQNGKGRHGKGRNGNRLGAKWKGRSGKGRNGNKPAGRAAPDRGGGATAAPPSGNGSIGSALGGVGHEFIKVRNSRHEISLSLVRVSASGCTHSVIHWAIVRLRPYPVSDNID